MILHVFVTFFLTNLGAIFCGKLWAYFWRPHCWKGLFWFLENYLLIPLLWNLILWNKSGLFHLFVWWHAKGKSWSRVWVRIFIFWIFARRRSIWRKAWNAVRILICFGPRSFKSTINFMHITLCSISSHLKHFFSLLWLTFVNF